MNLDRDERLAQVLADLSRPGHLPDWALLGQQYPDLVEELKQLLAIGQMMEMVKATTSAPTHPGKSRPAVALSPGKFGPYTLEEELGRGGMGVVYKAWDPALERFVALKTILRGDQASPTDIGRFRSEAQSAAGLEHPNIVPVYQVGEEAGRAYFCMKYVEGPTLAGVVKSGPLLPRRAARYLAAIARAVHHAHQKGILHRDLKPSNVLLDSDDQPLVTDFGLAKRMEGDPSLTGTGAILGTPSYLAPELASGQAAPASVASDVYSLGTILYEMLTGRPPFLAATAFDTLLLVRSEEPVRPRLFNPQIDLDLELICRKCLEKRPEHRYTSAQLLAEDLEAYLRGEAVSARSSSLVYFVNRLFRDTHHAPILENWGLLWIWNSLALLLLCFVTGGLYALDVREHAMYLGLWGIGLVVWGSIFWNLRRRGGPVEFVERQIAHVWGAGVVASIGIFVVEVLLNLDVLTLTPVLAVISGMTFLVMAGTLSGWFYLPAAVAMLLAGPMALIGPPWSQVMFGVVSAWGFLVPGLKYYWQIRKRG